MATRRVPLGSNPNAANSPLRASSASLLAYQGSKLSKARSHADMMREEAYGQPPPAKRQMVDHGVQRTMPSPTRPRPRNVVHRAHAPKATEQAPIAKRAPQTTFKPSEQEVDNIRAWQTQTRARFPKMVFYFESVSDDQRAKLSKQVTHLGARVETFFSSEITHLVTTRPIPNPRDEAQADTQREQPKTIDPSLLNRNADLGQTSAPSVRRKLLFDAKQQKSRSTDVLHRARELNKKIWSLEKLQKILGMVLEADPYKSAVLGHDRQVTAKLGDQSNFLQLLQAERVHGPSDRDPTVVTKELHYFKGPYIYVYDIEEKMKPIMVREYPKVADKKDGEWPQFRVASQGRCPFVEDLEPDKESRTQKRAAKAAVEAAAPSLRPPEVQPPKPVTGKRTLTEMEDGQNRGVPHRRNESFDRLKVSNPPSLDFRAPNQNAFMSHAKTGRFLAGEPVASGVQPSNITSAIRSQMISSTTGALGAKAGTSKEIHGLQRKVLVQKASTPAVSQDLSSRRMAEMSHDSNTFIRSASVSRLTRQLDAVDEDEPVQRKEKVRRTVSAPIPVRQKARDPKPGYCENCQDKFDDFDDHILSRKHRKFADNDDNWAQLDALLGQLKRHTRYAEDEW
ncbi:Dfp1/Him1, central region-domain-containing protein [Immersiella caudata]|uniref:Dfp1/Him1, central region-domain-containing protein n=1 Tax=Immersiella caudata TaxID=314043 RepID=A0AA39WKT8_9PEZI|nr:Dfp1/Him1, central region-domain-containing protein [Immersiella caudata]